MNDREIIDKIKFGDDDSFVNIVNNYKKKVISLCYSYTKDNFEAEDLSQEIFITFYNNIKKFRGECSISTYIYKIAVTKCLDFKRKRSLKSFLTGLFETNISNEDVDSKTYIRECINSLSNDIKIPVILFYYVGLTQKEIGDILNISSKAVEGRIYRAKQKLKFQFEQEGYLICSKNEVI